MRTTVTLDNDLAAKLKETAKRRGVPFKKVLNDALRSGLGANTRQRKFEMPTRELHAKPGVEFDHALQLSGELEDREIKRKLDLRK